MYRYIVLSIVAAFCFYSCSRQEAENFPRICVDANAIDGEGIPLSFFCDSLKYVPLETRDSCLLQEVKKIAVDRAGNIYVLDGIGSHSLFKFDAVGRFLHRIGFRGRGPGEYLSAEDFCVYQDSIIEIYDSGKEKILRYTASGNFIGEIPAWEEGCDAFIHVGDTLAFYIDSDYLPNLVIGVGDKKYSFWKKDFLANFSGYQNFSYNGEFILYSAYGNDTIYHFQNEKLQPYYSVDFGKDKLPQRMINSSRLEQTRYCYGVGDVKFTQHFLLFSFFRQGSLVNAVQNRQTGEFRLSKFFDNDIDQIPFLISSNSYFDTTRIATAVDAFSILSSYEYCQEQQSPVSPAFEQSVQPINENSNPVIVFAYLK